MTASPVPVRSTGLRARRPAHLAIPRRGRRATALLVGLVLLVGALCVVSAGSGQYAVGAGDVAASVLHRLTAPLPSVLHVGHASPDPFAEATLWQIRMPRIVLGLLVGACLGTAGAVMQGVFGNPLADPGVIGVSSGAALGAATAIALGVDVLGLMTVPAAAFAAGLVAVLVVYALSRSGGRTEVVTLLLTGIAVNAVAGAGLAFATFASSPEARDAIVFWQLGSLNGARWSYVVAVAPLAAVGLVGSLLLARRLDLLALGDRPARHLGVDVERLRLLAVLLVAVMVGAAVAFSGVIAFVGLVVPHLIRLVVGPGHRLLLVASALGGAALLAAADLAARTLVTYADLPIGMLTALVGGPFFLWLLRRSRARSGGWA